MKDLRVHLVPIGLDPMSRITDPLVSYKADRAYLITHLKDSQTAADNLDAAIKYLEANIQSCELHKRIIDIWDLFECLAEYRKIFQEEDGNHIYVNASTGSKIACITGMLACMMWGGTPYYARLDYSKQRHAKIEPMEVKKTVELPTYKLEMPDARSLQVMTFIYENGGTATKRDLIKELQKSGIMPRFGQNQRSAPHSRLKPILGPLESRWKFVEVYSTGNRSQVKLTDQGKTALRIFGDLKEQTETTPR